MSYLSSGRRISLQMGADADTCSEHPFTILDSRPHANEHEHEQGEHQPEYLIRYGWSSRNKGHSPHAETVWHTPSQVEKKMGVSRVTFENAVEAWENGLTPGQGASAASASAGKRDERKKKVPHPTTRQGKPGPSLLLSPQLPTIKIRLTNDQGTN